MQSLSAVMKKELNCKAKLSYLVVGHDDKDMVSDTSTQKVPPQGDWALFLAEGSVWGGEYLLISGTDKRMKGDGGK